MDVEELVQWNAALSEHYDWIVQVFIVVLATAVASFVGRRMLKRLQSKLDATANRWDDALAEAASRPLNVLIWVIGLTFAVDIVAQESDASIFDAADTLRDVGVIGAITWFLLRLVSAGDARLQDRAGQREDEDRLDPTTVGAIAKLIRLSIVVTAVLVLLQTLGISISGVLAFGGIGGIAVGFAARDLLANFFGGLIVYLDRPFAVGDWIRSPDRDIEGTVEYIGWRQTRIRTFNSRPLYVPNSVFASIVVENPSRMSHRRIYETIGIRYDDLEHMKAIVDDVREMLRTHEHIDENQTLMVNFDSFNDSSCDFFVYAFTHTTKWAEFHQVKQAVLQEIARIIAKHGAEIAFPTTTVHISPTDVAAAT